MKKKPYFFGTLIKTKRKNNSLNGNPNFYFKFNTLWNETLEGINLKDAGWVYSVCSNWVGKTFTVTYHITNNGKLIIDDMIERSPNA